MRLAGFHRICKSCSIIHALMWAIGAHGLINRSQWEARPPRLYTRRTPAERVYGSLARENVLSMSLNICAHALSASGRSDFQHSEFSECRKEITPDASVCVGISCYRALLLFLSSQHNSSNPFICVRITRSLRWQNSIKRCSNQRVLMLDAETVESWESQWEISPQMLKMWFQCKTMTLELWFFAIKRIIYSTRACNVRPQFTVFLQQLFISHSFTAYFMRIQCF